MKKKNENKPVSIRNYAKDWSILFALSYTIISLVNYFYNSILVILYNNKYTYDKMPSLESVQYDLLEIARIKSNDHFQILAYALTFTTIVVLIRFIYELTTTKKTKKKSKDKKILSIISITTSEFIIITLIAGVFQNILVNETSVAYLHNHFILNILSNIIEFPKLFIFPIVTFYAITLYKRITR